MTIAPKDRSDRLDSWKAIADYLGRDVRTLLRWEKEKGLPVHRVPGAKRQAVFAFVQELDEWLVKSGDSTSEAGSAPFEDNAHAEFEIRRPHVTFGEWQEAAGTHSQSARAPIFDEPHFSERELQALTNRRPESFGDKFGPELLKGAKEEGPNLTPGLRRAAVSHSGRRYMGLAALISWSRLAWSRS